MSDENDSQNHALMSVAAVIAATLALGLAVRTSLGGASGNQQAAGAALAVSVVGAPAGRVYFELGSDALPPEASALLVEIADAARMDGDKLVLISGFHDAIGNAAANAELAKKRAMAVRHALEANGVAPDRLLLDKPTLTAGGADPRDARRVEVRLR